MSGFAFVFGVFMFGLNVGMGIMAHGFGLAPNWSHVIALLASVTLTAISYRPRNQP